MSVVGPVAIVTGGGTGIGRCVSQRLARDGAGAVVVTYSKSRDDAARTVDELVDLGCSARAILSDVAIEIDSRRLVAEVLDEYGRIDFLVNAAGYTQFVPSNDLESLTDELWDLTYGVNVKGTFYCSRAAAQALRNQRGSIVNIASIAGLRGAGSSIPYAVSKAGVIQLTRSLAVALAPAVRVNAVAPGYVGTRWNRAHLSDAEAEREEQEVANRTPLGRVTTPDDVAEAIIGLLNMKFVTGQFFVVDGGRSVLY